MRTALTATKVALFGILLTQGACATFVHGTTQSVPVTSSPTGATVSVDSVPIGRTPLVATLARKRLHTISVIADSGGGFDIALAKRRSALVYWNILALYGFPIDFYNGAAYRVDPDSVHAVLPAGAMVLADAKPGLFVSAGNTIRMRTSNSPDRFVYATVDSSGAGKLVVRTSVDSLSPPTGAPERVATTDVHRLDFRVGPERRVNGQLFMRVTSRIALGTGVVVTAANPVGTLFWGGLINIGATPLGYLLGYSLEETRWSPQEAHRMGSELVVGNRVRVQFADPSRQLLKGRFVDMDGANLHIATGNDTLRVMRTDIASVERAGGLDYKTGALLAIAVGAAAGLSVTAGDERLGADRLFAPFAGALLALYSLPAFAPRRWVKVLRW